MNVLNLRTGEPFDPLPRLHHREESALQVSSSEHSARARGMLLAARSFYIGGAKKSIWTLGGYYASNGAFVQDESYFYLEDYIPCDVSISNGKFRYVFKNPNDSSKIICYDSNKAKVDYWGNSMQKGLVGPATTRFVRFATTEPTSANVWQNLSDGTNRYIIKDGELLVPLA